LPDHVADEIRNAVDRDGLTGTPTQGRVQVGRVLREVIGDAAALSRVCVPPFPESPEPGDQFIDVVCRNSGLFHQRVDSGAQLLRQVVARAEPVLSRYDPGKKSQNGDGREANESQARCLLR